jgi:hypothetical protein
MEELHDSLEDYKANDYVPVVVNRSLTTMGDYSSDDIPADNSMDPLQTGPFIVHEARAPTGGEFDFTRIGVEENPVRSSLVYRRSGPEGSPAFNASSGFLPQRTTDEESVIFRPVGQLDFSALDDTERNEDMSRNRTVSTPQKSVSQISYVTAEREEVYGSQDMDDTSRNDSPTNGFYEMNQSPRRSSESDEGLDSRVIFSPLNKMDNGDFAENIPRYESERPLSASAKFQNDEQGFHEPNLAKSSPKEMGKSSPRALLSYMSPGEVNVARHQHINSPGSVRNVPDMERREVFVSIPAVDQHRESMGTSPGTAHNNEYQKVTRSPGSVQNKGYQKVPTDTFSQEKHAFDQEPRVTHIHIQGNASWDIPVSESSQQTHSKVVKPQQKALNERRPFVSSVRSESYNTYLQNKDSHLPRPKTKGSDASKSTDTARVNAQRTETSRHTAGDKKISGPIPSHTESRVMARRNLASGQGERQVKTEPSKRTQEEKLARSYPGSEAAARSYPGSGAAKVPDHSPVHPAANVVTQMQHYQSDGEEVLVTHRHIKVGVAHFKKRRELGHIKLIIWFSGPPACIQMVPHGQFYCHFYKIKVRTAELHYSGEKIVMGFHFRLIQSISGIKHC